MANNPFALFRPLLLLLLLLAGLSRAEPGEGLLWRIESPQGQVSYLFGTIHSEDPRVLALPAAVSQAFAAAKTLALEVDLGKTDNEALGQALLLPAGKDLEGLIGAKLYRQSITAMAGRGFPEKMTRRMRPWAIVLTLSMPPPKTGLFLDYVLYMQAVEQGKAVVGLERMEEQLAVFTSLSVAEQVNLLRDTLSDFREFPKMFEQLIEAYLERDLQALARLSEQGMRGGDPALTQRFMDRLVDQRNRRMASRLLPLLQQGGVFAAVGALHLPGDDGILNLLRRRGFRVSALY